MVTSEGQWKGKVDVRGAVARFFRERGRGCLKDIVEYVYGGRHDSGKTSVLRAIGFLRSKEGEKTYGLKVIKVCRGVYAAYNPEETYRRISQALLRLREKGHYIVTPITIKIEASLEEFIPLDEVERLALRAKRELKLDRPSIGAITR